MNLIMYKDVATNKTHIGCNPNKKGRTYKNLKCKPTKQQVGHAGKDAVSPDMGRHAIVQILE